MLSFPFSKVHLVHSAQIRLNSELREDNAPSSTTTVETAVMCSNLLETLPHSELYLLMFSVV